MADAKRRIGDRVALMGGVNTLTLANGTPDQVRAEAIQKCREGGPQGYILAAGDMVHRHAHGRPPSHGRWPRKASGNRPDTRLVLPHRTADVAHTAASKNLAQRQSHKETGRIPSHVRSEQETNTETTADLRSNTKSPNVQGKERASHSAHVPIRSP